MAILTHPGQLFYQLMALGGGLWRESFRCAGSIISYELIARTERDLQVRGKLHDNSHNVNILETAMAKVVDFSIERIRQGETHIKSSMFLKQILAHVEALENGVLSESSVAQS
ncbi:hypothetical protein K461DRAFT_322274 [Myriangium duriaei CBS 260.36]|uniref:Uncharacterized protein n=1 Tax=Myriangium duriaei CBS 260.36 TaxID=1168546 RepID=A0A9P4IVY1_9PEZI|nr:hypothetical protein K461DRAFT_322274 [Myriangium duriaei CBS 260.36]